MSIPVPMRHGATGLNHRPGSGAITLADRVTMQDILSGTYNDCFNGLLPRGHFGGVNTLGILNRLGWVVTSSKIEKARDNDATLTINWEAGGIYGNPYFVPADEFDLQPMELYPATERHQIYNETHTGAGTRPDIKFANVLLVNSAVRAQSVLARDAATNALKGITNSDQLNMAISLLDKFRRGEETFYIAGFRYTWSRYSFSLPSLTSGGFIQDPLGPLSGYFYGLSFLRLADALQPAGVNGSMYKITHTWLGGPLGHWEVELYGGGLGYWNPDTYFLE